MQGFSAHMKLNHEKLRDKFVNFEGQKELSVRVDEFEKGKKENDWPSVFNRFS